MDYQERNVTSPGKMIIVSDINIHTNKEQHPDSTLFQETLDGLGLRDHVDFATHHFGNSLDAVITSQDDPIVNTVVQGELFSDHHWVFFNITSSIIMYQVEEIDYRKIKPISPGTFAGDISCELELSDVDHLNLKLGLALYNSTLTKVLNWHAPMKRKSAPIRKQVPWFTESIRDEVRKHRQLEQIWRQDKVNLDKYQDFCTQCRLVSNLLFLTEREYYHDIFHEHGWNTKQMFKVCDGLLGRGKEPSLPSGFTNQELADNFNEFFINKITNIRSDLSKRNTGSSDTQAEHCSMRSTLRIFDFSAVMKYQKLSQSHQRRPVMQIPFQLGCLRWFCQLSYSF